MVQPASADCLNTLYCEIEVCFLGRIKERYQVDTVLRSRNIVPGEELERDEMTGLRHGNDETRHELDGFCRRSDLRLDTRAGKEHVDDDVTGTARCGRNQSYRGEPAGGVLFRHGNQAIAACGELSDDGLGLEVTGNGNSDVDVTRESWLGPSGHGEPADDSPWDTKGKEVVGHLA